MYTLIDGESRNAEYPDTFEIPSVEERRAVTSGDYVKLGFEYDDPSSMAGERMWVEVATVGDKLTGTLANEPIGTTDLEHGDEVGFELRHIIGLLD
jgi:uncharacterized protein YegJ (DUF2314 family)